MLSWTVARSWPAPATGGWVGLPPPWAWVCREVTADLPDCLPLPSVRRTRDGCWQGPAAQAQLATNNNPPPPPLLCRAAADYLLQLLDRQRFSGVCYYDEAEREWVVADPQGRRQPRASSPIREAQCLTLFDEARCRGADLQLRHGAVGLLTLGPATTKDKLMQSAGRLRKLGELGRRGGGRRVPADSSVERQQPVCFPLTVSNASVQLSTASPFLVRL